MAAQTTKGKEVRKYYLDIEREWKTQIHKTPQISQEQIEAFIFQKDIFRPWIQNNPLSGKMFLSWQGIDQPIMLESVSTVNNTNTDSLLELIDTLSLTANRAGLAGNKSTIEAKFLAEQLKDMRTQLQIKERCHNEELERLNNKIQRQTLEIIELKEELTVKNAEVNELIDIDLRKIKKQNLALMEKNKVLLEDNTRLKIQIENKMGLYDTSTRSIQLALPSR